jgi:CBS-domain-containing membrane protein/PII-like signaling protein
LENHYNHNNEKEVAMPNLSLQKKAKRLRIYISESDRWRGKALDAQLLETLRAKGMAGATVFRGISGFGAHSRIHTTRIEVLSFDLPVVIEVVDTPENIESILDVVYPMVREGLMTVEDVQIVKYTHRFLNPLPADRLVSEVMTRKVITLLSTTPIHQAWKQMLENQVKATPVTDQAGKVVGILTDEDLLERAGVQQRLSVAIRMDASEINQELHGLESSPLTVADVMTKPVVTILADETLGVATVRMVKSGLKRLPVVDSEEKLVGILSRLDILRQVANAPFAVPETRLPEGTVKTVKEMMSSDIPMVSQDDDLSSIIEKFSKSYSHRLVVVDSEGKAVGLISDSDVIARVQPFKRRGILDAFRQIGKPPVGKETAFDLMSPNPLTCVPDLALVDAIKMMLADARKWLVVVDENGKPLGLVDRQILLEAIASIR